MNSYKDLLVWQKAMDLVVMIYRVTKLFPKEELFVLVSQMRRAAISIPSNLAEGYVRRTRKEYIQFVRIAFGSGAELETQLEIARRLEYVTAKDFSDISTYLAEVLRMLNGLLGSLKKNPNR